VEQSVAEAGGTMLGSLKLSESLTDNIALSPELCARHEKLRVEGLRPRQVSSPFTERSSHGAASLALRDKQGSSFEVLPGANKLKEHKKHFIKGLHRKWARKFSKAVLGQLDAGS
jgi:hypothetical protein